MNAPATPVAAPPTSALVSVVTPFYNTSQYLAQCIDSVLAQSYPNFEYILVDNCSTDGSTEIAEGYARRDPRIRLIRRSQLLPQVQNYNGALTEISAGSKYCKIVQADDYIFPDCLRLMVEALEQSETIGLVSSYSLAGNAVQGSGYPFPMTMLPGKECARLYLRTGIFVFGTPTTVIYRSSIIRDNKPFYKETILHEDFDKCLEILQEWDFGFVHQVLSFTRIDNESLYFGRGLQDWRFSSLTRYSLVLCYAPVFLAPDEATSLKKETRQIYYDVLAREALRFRGRSFWRYHREGLKSIGETLDRRYLTCRVGLEFLRMSANLGTIGAYMVGFVKRRIGLRHRPGAG
jgi:glycosyltransferase involved in cell wall biosynthesis